MNPFAHCKSVTEERQGLAKVSAGFGLSGDER